MNKQFNAEKIVGKGAISHFSVQQSRQNASTSEGKNLDKIMKPVNVCFIIELSSKHKGERRNCSL